MRTPAGHTLTLATTRSVSGLLPANPFAFTTATTSTTINGKTYTATYDATSRRITSRTPTGRTATMDVDTLGRPTLLMVPGSGALSLTYGGRGEIVSAAHGARTMTFTYDDALRVTAARDMLNRVTRFDYDVAGRLETQTLLDGRTIAFGHDVNGNLTAVTPPGRDPHAFGRTAVDLVDAYTVAGAVTRYVYDADRQLTQVMRPDGETLTLSYDAGGRLAGITGEGANVGYTYAASGLLRSATTSGGPFLMHTTVVF